MIILLCILSLLILKKSFFWILFLVAGYIHFLFNNKVSIEKNFVIINKRAHRFLSEIFDKNFNKSDSKFLKAIILGDRTRISKTLKERFKRTGTIHFFAISGLHMGIIWFFFFMFFRLLRVPYKLSYILSSLFLSVYTTAIPLRPSVLRANIMIFVFSLMAFLERESLSLNTLGMAGFISLIIHPLWLFDHGFILSYLATGGILLFYPPLFNFFKTKFVNFNKYMISPVIVSFSAQISVLPYILYYFKYLSLISIISNLILTPFLTLNIISSFIFVLFYPFPFFIKEGVRGFVFLSKDILFYLNNALSSFKFSCVYVKKISPLIFLIYPLIIFSGFLLNSKARDV